MPGRWVYAKRDPYLITQLMSQGFVIEYIGGGIRYWDNNALTGDEHKFVTEWLDSLNSGGGGTATGGVGGSSGGGGGGIGGGTFLTTVTGREVSQEMFDSWFADLAHVARQYGRDLSAAQGRLVIEQDVTPEEFVERQEVLDWIGTNKNHLDQFGNAAKRMGIKTNFTFKDRVDYVYKALPGQFNQLLNLAGAFGGGYEVTKKGTGDLALTSKQVTNFQKRLPGGQTLAELTPVYQQAASLATQLLPLSRLRGYKLTERELLDAAGGLASAETVGKIQRLIDEEAALREALPTTSTAGRSGGLAGSSYG